MTSWPNFFMAIGVSMIAILAGIALAAEVATRLTERYGIEYTTGILLVIACEFIVLGGVLKLL